MKIPNFKNAIFEVILTCDLLFLKNFAFQKSPKTPFVIRVYGTFSQSVKLGLAQCDHASLIRATGIISPILIRGMKKDYSNSVVLFRFIEQLNTLYVEKALK